MYYFTTCRRTKESDRQQGSVCGRKFVGRSLWVPGERSGGGGGEGTRGRAASMAAIANLTYTTTTTTSSYSLWSSSSSVVESGNRYSDGGTVGWFQQQVLVSRSLRMTYCASASLTRATECEKRFWRARKSSARGGGGGGGGQRFLEQGEGRGWWQGALLFVTTPKKLLACGCEGEKWRRRRRQSVLNCCCDKASENAAVQVRLEILAVYLYAIQHISRVFSFFTKAIVLG